MRPTKEALVRKVCQNMDLLKYEVDDVLTDDALQDLTNEGSDKVIFSIAKPNQVSSKLFLTSHQFTNVVGTDIYIYIGNNQFIHASSGGGKVQINSLSESYYNTHYYGARRIVN